METQNIGDGGSHLDAHMQAHMHAHNAAMTAQNLHLAAVDQHAYGHQAYGAAHANFGRRRSSSHQGHNHVHGMQPNALVLQAYPGVQTNAAIKRTKYVMIISGLIVGGLYGGLLAVNISDDPQPALFAIEVAFLLIVVTNILMGIRSKDSIKRNHACIAKTTTFTFTVGILLVVANFVTTIVTFQTAFH